MSKKIRMKVGVRSTHQVNALDHLRWGQSRNGNSVVSERHLPAFTPVDVFMHTMSRKWGHNG